MGHLADQAADDVKHLVLQEGPDEVEAYVKSLVPCPRSV